MRLRFGLGRQAALTLNVTCSHPIPYRIFHVVARELMCIDHEAIEKNLLCYHGQGEQFSKALVVTILLEQPGFVEHASHLRAWDIPGGHPFNSIGVIRALRDIFI